jgi:AcrR family transcriptional regulator
MEGLRSSSHEGRMRGQERRALILAQAKKVFARTGYAQASMGELARASHVTEALLYKHFESKKHLYLTVLQEVGDHFLSSFYERVRARASHDLLEALSTLLIEFRVVALKDPESLQILLSASVGAEDPLILQMIESYSSRISIFISHLLQEAKEQGLLPSHLDLAAASWGYLSFLFAIGERVKLHVTDQITDQITEQTLYEMNRLWLAALRSG